MVLTRQLINGDGGFMKKTAFVIISLIIPVVLMCGTLLAAIGDEDFDRALELYRTGQYAEALSALDEYVRERPEAYAYYLKGYALYALGRHGEATKSFQDAYLIDPEFSPEEFHKAVGMYKEFPVSVEPAEEAPPPVAAPEAAPAAAPEAPPPVAAPIEEAAPEAAPAPPPTEEKPVPSRRPPSPPLKAKPPVEVPGQLKALFAGLGVFAAIIPLALYVYFSLCIFLIARKLAVSGAWMSWVPLLQCIPMLRAADKPVWWLIPILLVPVANIIMLVIVFMAMAENLGRSRVLGILMLLPVVNLAALALLAFSKHKGGVSPERFAFPELPEVPREESVAGTLEYEATTFGGPQEAAPEEPQADFAGLMEETEEAPPPGEAAGEEFHGLEEFDLGEEAGEEELTPLEDEELFRETEGEAPSLEELGFAGESFEDIPELKMEDLEEFREAGELEEAEEAEEAEEVEEAEEAEEAEEVEEAEEAEEAEEVEEAEEAEEERPAGEEDATKEETALIEEGLPPAEEAPPFEEPSGEDRPPF